MTATVQGDLTSTARRSTLEGEGESRLDIDQHFTQSTLNSRRVRNIQSYNVLFCVSSVETIRAHYSTLLKSLHWLPVRYRIDFEIRLLVQKSLTGLGPEYINEMLLDY